MLALFDIEAWLDKGGLALLVLLFLTRATPMLLAGDERARTQRGNNNAWCHDDERVWIDWAADDRGRVDLVRRLGGLRRELAPLALDRCAELRPFAATAPSGGPSVAKAAPAGSAALLLFRGEAEPGIELILAINPGPEAVRLPLPRAAGGNVWWLAVDTHRTPPIPEPGDRPGFASDTAELEVRPHGLRVLVSRSGGRSAGGTSLA